MTIDKNLFFLLTIDVVGICHLIFVSFKLAKEVQVCGEIKHLDHF